jgi:hypothetical protein
VCYSCFLLGVKTARLVVIGQDDKPQIFQIVVDAILPASRRWFDTNLHTHHRRA